ncbi:EboA domain-containing protein [Streptomyces iconiensis]|uniref:EboA domain-containing protein n=1 Tax=Streptomyces iconiensis TaxID=1384038 RepID=A0ABT6ZZF5_9ACTN|nr:EboA domain-containing protein [Streptomyces iconiensis]MDJ1134451.1 EboA domain-containing protein [Streptomyces iconiensis]
MLTPLATLRTGLELRLGAGARAWLHQALATAADAPHHVNEPGLPPWERDFAQAGRQCGPHALRPEGEAGVAEAAVPPRDPADTARVLILHAAAPDTATLARLYEHGTAAERRAVLLALPHLDPPPEREGALTLVEDALRTNDTRLVAAALGPYAAAHLDAHQWRQAVLKCLFTGVPLSAVAGLEHRAAGDGELARMLEDYARERTAAGREVPSDLHTALDLARFPHTAEGPAAQGTGTDPGALAAPGTGGAEAPEAGEAPDSHRTPRSPQEP